MLGVIFDWDGVVINSADLHEKSWKILAEELGFTLPVDHFEKGFGKRNETIIGKMLCWSKDQAEIIRLGNRKEEIYRELGIEKGISLVPGSKEFIEMLCRNSVPMSIGTSTERKNIDLAIEQNQLGGLFSGAVCSEDVSKGKPDPEVFLKAAELINVESRNCIVFEDSTHGIEAAIAAEMNPVGITTTNREIELLESGAQLVVERLDEITLSILKDLIKSA
ncbi:MAG: HAD-IA family hydrolase [Verrucomicrobiota bacterium]|nr:HAD-IA family hydrolase [Verrucomicrobiota bacterium]